MHIFSFKMDHIQFFGIDSKFIVQKIKQSDYMLIANKTSVKKSMGHEKEIKRVGETKFGDRFWPDDVW